MKAGQESDGLDEAGELQGDWIFETATQITTVELSPSGWQNFRVTYKAAHFKTNLVKLLPPSHWGITGKQLLELADQVVEQFTGDDENPNVYQVVEKLIKPLCLGAGVSYSALLNPKGLKCSTFVTHAWFESFLMFVEDLQGHFPDFETRVFWICFAANPQTWPHEELKNLLGPGALQSPFAIALQQCESFVVVRNTTRNIYSRLWCVAELVFARAFTDHSIQVIGRMPPRAAKFGDHIGLGAKCSDEDDRILLHATIQLTGLDANALVAKVVEAAAGSILRPGEAGF